MMAACSSEDTAQNNNPVAGRQMHFTATIAAPNSGAGTRTEYTEDTENKKITVAWKVGDEIALVHDKVMDVVKVKTVNADGSATIDGTITSATDEATVQLVYPAARVSAVNSDGNPEFNETVSGKLLTQDGTLTYIQNNIDFRDGEGQLSVNGTEVTLKKAADMVSSIAIWKLTLQDNAATPAALAAKQVKIKSGGNDLASTAVLTTGKSTLYLAVPVVLEQTITIEATVDEDTYSFTKNVTLNASAYYQSTVTMAKIVDLSTVTTATTIEDGYTVTGTLGENVKILIADGATVTLDDVTITGENNSRYTWAGITCDGDATIILKDGSTNTVTGFFSTYPGIQAGPTGTTLTIKGETAGTGKLTASSNGGGAGIGGAYQNNCGNIVIEGGVITATGSSGGAGIGGAYEASCGTITISGGNVTATGGSAAAGIGSGEKGTCTTITISGGTVSATGGAFGAGIGSGNEGTCGAITISGGTVSATGGEWAAGIGSGVGAGDKVSGTCGDILISGGTVSATGGAYAAAIGSGDEGSCGRIEITTDVTQVTAKKVSGFETIGRGGNGYCTNVSIGGTVYWNGSAYQNGGDTYLLKSTIFYPVPAPIALSAVTSSQLGWIVGNDGKAYAEKPLPAGVDAVAKICYVGSSTGVEGYTHGLALALADEAQMSWFDATGASGAAAHTPAAPTTITSSWLLPSEGQWVSMIAAAGGYEALREGFSGIAGAYNLESNIYWSSSPGSDNDVATGFDFYDGKWYGTLTKRDSHYVRACLAF